ncbi:YihY/virulence factor BrkB family protein [Chloroflexota bacterium]
MRLNKLSTLTSTAKLLKESVHEFLTDNCPHLAAGISYYFLLSLFPLALALISIAGFILRSPEVESSVADYIANTLPAAGDFVASTLRGVARSWTATGIMATIGLLVAGLGVFTAVRKSLNTAWGVKKPRAFLRERLMELGMMVGVTILFAASFSFTTILNITPSFPIFGQPLISDGLLQTPFSTLFSVLLSFVTFIFLYKFVPNIKTNWRSIWLGALVAALAFVGITKLFIWFLAGFANYNLVYGSLGTLMGLMTWVYVSSVIMLFCAKFISVYSRKIPVGKAKVADDIS